MPACICQAASSLCRSAPSSCRWAKHTAVRARRQQTGARPCHATHCLICRIFCRTSARAFSSAAVCLDRSAAVSRRPELGRAPLDPPEVPLPPPLPHLSPDWSVLIATVVPSEMRVGRRTLALCAPIVMMWRDKHKSIFSAAVQQLLPRARGFLRPYNTNTRAGRLNTRAPAAGTSPAPPRPGCAGVCRGSPTARGRSRSTPRCASSSPRRRAC